jgi:1-acyl-sn-glycerol-3-phosphate acyltransferase
VWAAAFLAVLMPFGMLSYPFDRRQRLHDVLSVVWARGVLAIAGVRIRARAVEHAAPGERYVVVSNHQSLVDVLALLVVLQPRMPIRFAAKQSLFRLPVLGWGMRLYRHLPVDRTSVRSALGTLKAARASVKHGYSMVFFPEGTRSRTGEVGPFRPGAFRVASETGTRLLPVTIDGTMAVMPKGQFAASPGEVTVTVHPPMDPPGGTMADLRAATAACRERIELGLRHPEAA